MGLGGGGGSSSSSELSVRSITSDCRPFPFPPFATGADAPNDVLANSFLIYVSSSESSSSESSIHNTSRTSSFLSLGAGADSVFGLGLAAGLMEDLGFSQPAEAYFPSDVCHSAFGSTTTSSTLSGVAFRISAKYLSTRKISNMETTEVGDHLPIDNHILNGQHLFTDRARPRCRLLHHRIPV